MATLVFSFDTGSVPLSRIVDAFAAAYGYADTIDGSPNPETKTLFARRIVRQLIVQVVRSQDAKAAAAAVAEITLT